MSEKKVILLSAADLALRGFTGAESNSVYRRPRGTTGIIVSAKEIEACDGYIVVWVPTQESDEFPPVDGMGEAIGDRKVQVHQDTLAEVEKHLPKGCEVEILRNAALTVKKLPNKEDEWEPCLATTNLETTTLIRGKEVRGDYPDTQATKEGTKPDHCTHRLGIEPMKKLLAFANKYCEDGYVTFNFPDTGSEVATFSLLLKDGRTMRGLIRLYEEKQ